jgi:murein hydrolase activator
MSAPEDLAQPSTSANAGRWIRQSEAKADRVGAGPTNYPHPARLRLADLPAQGEVRGLTFAVLFSISCFLISGAAIAATASIAERYEHARQTLEQSRANEAATQAERDRLNAEARALSERLVANAARVQALEGQLGQSQKDLARLSDEAAALQIELARGRDRVARLLAVLQRLDNDEPPALALRPDDSLAAARGAMLVGNMLPPVYGEAHALALKLRVLGQTRAAIETKRIQARAEAAALTAARASLAALQVRRAQEAAKADLRLGELHAVTEDIAHHAGDLKALIDRIAEVRLRGAPEEGMVVVTAENARNEPLIRGSLRKPVVGVMSLGDPAGPGITPGNAAQGLWFEGAGGAQAVAPIDGEVVFAGAYQKFGQVLILEIAGGYHLVLAGMGRIDVRIGDLMLAGEPVGVLPAGPSARLYMELRRGGQTVNPAPWMSVELRKARG